MRRLLIAVALCAAAAACGEPSPLAGGGCAQCHAPLRAGIGPSWQTIGRSYCRDGAGGIIRFLRGQAEPRGGGRKVMKAVIARTATWDEARLEKIAGAVLMEAGCGDTRSAGRVSKSGQSVTTP